MGYILRTLGIFMSTTFTHLHVTDPSLATDRYDTTQHDT